MSPSVPRWNTIPEILVACAEHRPDMPVMLDATGTGPTASQLLDTARRGAGFLAGRGVGRGDFVGVDTATLTWQEVAAAYFSVIWLGAAAVLLQGTQTRQVARRTTGLSLVVGATDDAADDTTDGAPDSVADGADEALVALEFADVVAGPPLPGPPTAQPEDRLDLVFTSGTTGPPKPVASTHSQWTGAVRPEIMRSRVHRVVGHTGVPIGASGGVHAILLNHVARGVTSLCARTPAELRDAAAAREVYELHLTTHAARSLCRLMGGPQPWAEAVRLIRVVGGALPAALAEQLAQVFARARVVSLYGLTEGGAALFVRVANRGEENTIGRPVPGTQVRVLDEHGREAAAGEIGELAVRAGGATAPAYFGQQGQQAADPRTPAGWTRTGDLGYVDGSGRARLVGRARELIVLRGGRVSPEAVEDILSRHVPSSVEFAVVGLLTPGTWDRIAVFVSGPADDPRVAEAQARLAAMKGPFRPHTVRTVPAIPRNAAGKPLRGELVRELTDG
jgi:acyl-CoA synthetase (AMP-forming)/AMP-acid ligase II